ncbi:MAG: ADOP family duplicated permease [Thermoanaerobaculia bacterium]
MRSDGVGPVLRQVARSLRRDPVYSLSAVAVLSLGVAAVVLVAAVARAVLFAPLPYPQPDRLVRVGQLFAGFEGVANLSTVDARAVEEADTGFEAFGVAAWGSAALSGDGTPETVRLGRATAGLFTALAVPAGAGRLIVPADAEPGAPPVAVLSNALAGRRFGGAAAALGRTVTLDGVPHAVVGVLPPGHERLGPGVRAEVWTALSLEEPTRRGPFWLRGVGRLRPEVSVAAADGALTALSERIFPLWAASFRDETARIAAVPLRDSIVGKAGESVGVLAAAVLLVLLVAVVNVATLALVRASVHEPELGVRAALGAGRLRLALLPLVEGLLVGLAAAGGGIALAAVILPGLVRAVSALPRLEDAALDGSVLALGSVVALAAGLAANLAPAVAALRTAPREAGTQRGRSGSDRPATTLRAALVAAEFALALPLLVGAGLLLGSFVRLQAVDPGFDPEGAVSLSASLPEATYPDGESTRRFWRELARRALELPGVAAAGVGTELPAGDVWNVNNFDLTDRPVPAGGAEHVAPWLFVTPQYFEALGVRLLEGRMLRPDEVDEAAPPVALVSRHWAERYYPGESAIGRRMVSGGCTTCPPTEVVGVVDDVKYRGLADDADAVYEPFFPSTSRTAHLIVRGTAPTAVTLQALRTLVAELDPELPVAGDALSARLRNELAGPGRSAALLGSFAATALLLAALGLFGSMSYVVRRRRREIGLRMALGATPAAIRRMVVRRGVLQAACGSAVGLALALLEARWLAGFLFEVSPVDPGILAAGVALLLAVAGAACWIPGRHAARVDPLRAITSD